MSQEYTGSPTLILGTGAFAAELVDVILAQPEAGYELVGVVSAQTSAGGGRFHGIPILGTADELNSIVSRTGAERIIVALPPSSGLLPDYQLIEARISNEVIVLDGDDVYELLTGKLRIEALEPRRMIFNRELMPSSFAMAAARLMSFLVAVPALIVLAPFLLLIALAIRLDSEGPVLFVQERVGLGGKPFKLLKFRSMRPEDNRKSEWAGDNSHRITKVGRILRKYRLDELPQLINVLRGDMNLVGPRPHPASNFRMFVLVSRNTPECGFQIPYYSLRTMVRPGITGWAQVRYRYANNLTEEIEKLRFDLYYVKHYSILLDLRILYETVAVVFFGREFATDPAPEEAAPAKRNAKPRLAAVSAGAVSDAAPESYEETPPKRAVPGSKG
ncbi:MAG: sugar transferase [Pseudomonadota bacterium]|nr:sugar transferase [Pseudomonadota bacterium]